jgi:SAM-dependent methyltransferase
VKQDMASSTISSQRGHSTIVDGELWDLRALRSATRYQRWVLESFGSALSGRVLEVGAGNGNFTRWLPARVASVVALEPEPEMRQELLELHLKDVEVLGDPLETYASGRTFDCVLMINVLEHIADEGSALEAARSALRPGGRICILAPAHQLLFGSLDHKYQHFRRYTRSRLARVLHDSGFVVGSCRYINPVGALGWFVATRLMRVPRLTRGSVAASEHLAVPLGRRIDERGVRLPFGQSVIAVATRDEGWRKRGSDE